MYRHLPQPKSVTQSTMPVPSPCLRRYSWACNNVVLPEPVMPAPGLQRCRPPRAHDVIIPATSQSPWCHWTCALPEPATPSSSMSPATLYVYFFLCHFEPTNPDFDMLHCHITLIYYIAFVLLHCFDMLHCHIALICYMLHCFDMLHCHIALICYIASDILLCFDMLHCHITLICYIAFVLLHCFDILHCHITLICYTLLHCFCFATFWSILMHTTLLNDESGISEMSVATWTNIIVLLRFQLRTTWSR
jgi:hypothetical protein